MVDQRKITRAQAKLRTASARRTAEEHAGIRYARIAAALATVRSILADRAFIDLVRAHGVPSLPQALATQEIAEQGKALKPIEGHFIDRALDFAVAWRFFAPLLNNPAVVADMDTRWPGFTLELRDVFISLVADGPFPYQAIGRGHRTI